MDKSSNKITEFSRIDNKNEVKNVLDYVFLHYFKSKSYRNELSEEGVLEVIDAYDQLRRALD